jgi:hypothetical protein
MSEDAVTILSKGKDDSAHLLFFDKALLGPVSFVAHNVIAHLRFGYIRSL